MSSRDRRTSGSRAVASARIRRVLQERSLPTRGVLLVASCLAGVALIVRLCWDVPDVGEALLAGANAVLALFGGLWCCAGRLRPAGAVFFFFTFAWLGVAPIVQLASNSAAWGDAYVFVDGGRVYEGLAMDLIATLAFVVGGGVSGALNSRRPDHGRRRPDATSELMGRPRGVNPAALHFVALLLLTVAPVAIRANGGLGTFFVSQYERSDVLSNAGLDLANSGGVQVALVTTLPSALAAAGAVLAATRIQQVIRAGATAVPPLLWVEFLGFLGGLALFANPFSNTRFLSAAAVGALALVILLPRSAVAGALFAVVGLVSIVVLYPASSVFKTPGSTFSLDFGQAFTGVDFDGFQQVLNSIAYVRDLGHTGGIYLLSAVAYFVPRSAWPEKATPASIDVAAHAGYSFTNLSLPFHAELYIEFSWVGMVVGMALLGVVANRLDSAWLRRDWALVPLTAYVSLSMLSIVRGPLGAQVPVYLTVIIIIVLSTRFKDSVKQAALGSRALRVAHRRPRGRVASSAGRLARRSSSGRIGVQVSRRP